MPSMPSLKKEKEEVLDLDLFGDPNRAELSLGGQG